VVEWSGSRSVKERSKERRKHAPCIRRCSSRGSITIETRSSSNIVDFTTRCRENDRHSRMRGAFLPTSGEHDLYSANQITRELSCSRLRVHCNVPSTYPNPSFGVLCERQCRPRGLAGRRTKQKRAVRIDHFRDGDVMCHPLVFIIPICHLPALICRSRKKN